MLSLLITGSKGRMGLALRSAIEQTPEAQLGKGIDVGDSLAEHITSCDAVIDFSHHGFTEELLSTCLENKKHLVIGTTGHTQAELEKIHAASEKIPIVHASNFSIGVNTLFWLTRKASQILDENFNREVVEMHHRHKKDAPSGTARTLAEILCETQSLSYEKNTQHGRHGDVGARPTQEIGVHALRGGDVVGDHTVYFAADGERIELTHRATSRLTFALGAVKAALWLADKKTGLYTMENVLGLS